MLFRSPIVVSDVTPDEAIFSNGIIRCPLEAGPSKWAQTIIEASDIDVVLDSRSDNFNVSVQAEKLCRWYLKKAERLSR